MAAIPLTPEEKKKKAAEYAASQRANEESKAATQAARAERDKEDKDILKDYKGPMVGGAAAGAKADFVSKAREQRDAVEKEPSEFQQEKQGAQDFLDKIDAKRAAGPSDLMKQANKVMADIELARAETGLGRESEDSPAAPEAPAAPAAPEGANDFLAAQKDFNEKFGGSMGRAMEGETGDQYEARLKQRNVDRKAALGELAKLKPQDAAPAVADAAAPENTVLKPMGEITGTSFGDTSLDLTPREFMAPPASPQASSSARATASNAPTVITDPKERLKGRQEFGSYLENQLNRSGGSYTFNKGDQSRAKALGIGRKEMDNFMNRLGRRDDNQFGARGGLRRRNT